jgi:hypothetical protein
MASSTRTNKHQEPPIGDEAIGFLKKLRPNGPWLTIAIDPNKDEDNITAITATTPDQVQAFITEHNGTRNLYYALNPTRGPMSKKPEKLDLAAIEYLPCDLDPKAGEMPHTAKARYLAAIRHATPQPAAIIDSGNGLNALFKLTAPILLPNPITIMVKGKRGKKDKRIRAFPPATQQQIDEAEGCAKALMEQLSSVAGTQNIDRILRLPGTTNLPTKAKLEQGRVACQAKLIAFSGATCALKDFPEPTIGCDFTGLDQWIAEHGDRYNDDGDDDEDIDPYDLLPWELEAVIDDTPGAPDLSAAFMHAVCWLHELKWSAQKIANYLEDKPVTPERYSGRLLKEVHRCLHKSYLNKAKTQAKATPQGGTAQDNSKARGNSKAKGNGKAKGKTFSARELGAMNFPPIKYVVPGIIVEGLTLLAGKPKIGKSWLLLEIADAVADRGLTLGDIQCEQGDVLYCALEDNMRRLQDRMDTLRGTSNPEQWPERLHFRCQLPRLVQGGIEEIEDWIKAARHPRLVIIDTLAMVRNPKARDQTNYEHDYDSVKMLRDLANTHNIAVIIVTHLRKATADDPYDTVSGTLGLTGATDSILVIYYEASCVVLKGKGRDLMEFEKALSFDKSAARWTITGEAEDVRRSTERGMILRALDDADPEPLGPRQIAEATGMKVANVKFLLSKLLDDEGVIEKARYGKYRRRETPKAGPQKPHRAKNSARPAPNLRDQE